MLGSTTQGVGMPGDEVICSTFAFVASTNAIVCQGAVPVFIDSDATSWNMDPGLLAEFLEVRSRAGRLPKAVVLVHLYGQPADIETIAWICGEYGVALIEDAAGHLVRLIKTKPRGLSGGLGCGGFFVFVNEHPSS